MPAKQAAAGFQPWIDGYYGLSTSAQLVQSALGSGEAQEPFDVFMYGNIPLPQQPQRDVSGAFYFGDRVLPHSPGWPGAAAVLPSPAFSVKFTA